QQLSPNINIIQQALENDDAFVRRNARFYLAKMGIDAIPIINQLLSSGNYRLELGGLAALAEMPPELRVQMPDEIKKQVKRRIDSPDPTTKETAARALSGN